MTDTPRTDEIWGGERGYLYYHPHLEKAVEETRLIESDLKEAVDTIKDVHDNLRPCLSCGQDHWKCRLAAILKKHEQE